jgi:hypothetical protein
LAAVQSSQVKILYDSNLDNVGAGERVILARIRRVATLDTWDVAAYFAEVTVATEIASGVLATIGTAVAAGTVITITQGSLDTDTIYVLVKGQSAV